MPTIGKQTLKQLSKDLTKEFGKGFSVSNLQFMRRFYQNYQIQQTVSVKLSWSHYCELLTISDADKRSFYEKESINSGWSIRELKRQISTSLYERLLLSEGKTNKETVLALAEKGIEMATPLDIIKDPYVYLMRADRIWRVKHNGKNDQSNRQGKTVCKIGYDTTQNQYRGDI